MSLKCKKLTVMLLTAGLILGLMNLAQAQSVQTQPKSGLGAKVGYFMPGDNDVSDIWGSGLTLGADYLYAFPPYGIDFGVEYFSKEKEETVFPITVKVGWRVVPVTASFLYFFPGRVGFSPYVGGGIGYYFAKLDAEIAVVGIPFLAGSAEGSGFGFHAKGGFTLRENLFAEVKYSIANLQDDIEADAGGLTILVGYRF